MNKSNSVEGLTDLLIATLFSARNSRTFREIQRERQFQRFKEQSVRTALSRLNHKGYLENQDGEWILTQKGMKYFESNQLFSYIPSPFLKNCAASIILSFDIPEPDRKIRNWLRNQIKIFGYKMLQQSLWIGPGPLPSDFLKRLEKMGIRKYIKTFKISPTKG